MNKLKVSEVFYSIQGEGGQAGTPMIFIRLMGCSMKHGCFKSGVICDTEFESGQPMSCDEILAYIKIIAPSCRHILWTGGEPLDQLKPEHLDVFTDYEHSLETSGMHPVHQFGTKFKYITVSPKVAEHVLAKNFGVDVVDELRYVRHKGQAIPRPSLNSRQRYISPHNRGLEIDGENLEHCIKLVMANPSWRLSVQQHKLFNLL